MMDREEKATLTSPEPGSGAGFSDQDDLSPEEPRAWVQVPSSVPTRISTAFQPLRPRQNWAKKPTLTPLRESQLA
jgi:hypothetical protein